jgi:hypothetical protein
VVAVKPEEFEEFIKRNPDEARRLISKAFVPRELLTVGNRSYINAYKNPESRFDPRDLCSDGHNCPPNPDMLQPLSDPGKLFTDKYLIPPSSLIFQWAGRNYGKKWWGEVAGGLTNAATVIQSELNALTAGRTWKELIVVRGNYPDLDQIKLPSYTEFNLIGLMKARANLNDHLITNSDHVGGNTDITIVGGHYDANKENQTADMSCVHLQNVQRPEVYRAKVRGGARPLGVQHGEGICLWDCDYGKLIHNYVYESFYDNIKIRGGSTHCLAEGNTCVDSETKGGIQVSSSPNAFVDVIANIIYQNFHVFDNGVRVHSASDVLIEGNSILSYSGSAVELMDAALNVTAQGNKLFTNSCGIHSWGTVPGVLRPSYVYLKNNTIVLLTVDPCIGVDITHGDYFEIKDNTIFGNVASVGIQFGATDCNFNRLGPNEYLGMVPISFVAIPDGIDVEFIDCENYMGATFTQYGAGAAQGFGVPVGKATPNNSETQMRQITAKPGIFRNFYVRSNVVAGVGQTWTFFYRNEGADTPITTTISGGARLTSFDRIHSFVCAAGDRIAVRITATAGTPAADLQWAVQFLPF